MPTMTRNIQADELLLCLTMSSNTETELNRFRALWVRDETFRTPLPPLIPLAYLDDVLSFEVARTAARGSWRPQNPSGTIELCTNAGLRSAIIPIDEQAWHYFKKEIGVFLERNGSRMHEDGALVEPGPWVYLGYSPVGWASSASLEKIGIPYFSIAKVNLSIFRLVTDISADTEYVHWEQLGAWKVPPAKDS